MSNKESKELLAFNDQLHEDLHNMFIRKFIETNRYLDLFPRTIHQERTEYEVYINDNDKAELIGEIETEYPVVGWQAISHSEYTNRMKFYFLDDLVSGVE